MRPPESFIGQPIRSLQTMLRVLAEDDPKHIPVIPDGIYGPETMAAVSRFQQLHGLPATGVTDQDTWEAIVREYDPALVRLDAAWPLEIHLEPGEVIRKGQRHPNVYLVQSILTVLGQMYGSIGQPEHTGVLDAQTSDALASFQEISGLPMTGSLDKNTWKHLSLQYSLASGHNYKKDYRELFPVY